jgi:hypothetical protein
MAPAREGFAGQEQARHAVAGIHVVKALDRPRPHWQRLAGLADQLLEGLVHAHYGALGVVWAVVDLQHIFHVVDELGRGLVGDAPHAPAVRMKGVLF